MSKIYLVTVSSAPWKHANTIYALNSTDFMYYIVTQLKLRGFQETPRLNPSNSRVLHNEVAIITIDAYDINNTADILQHVDRICNFDHGSILSPLVDNDDVVDLRTIDVEELGINPEQLQADMLKELDNE